MPILGIDTSSQVSSVAVLSDGRLASEITMQARLTHSETLLPHIVQALDMAGVKKQALTGIAVSIGPGSFTGLRIGLAAAKAMSYALRVPIMGIPSLEALAMHYPVPGLRLYAMMDAQKKNAYVLRCHWARQADGLQLVSEEPVSVRPFAEVLAEIGAEDTPSVLLGDIVQRRIAGIGDLPPQALLPPPELIMPRAAHVAVLGARRLARGETDNLMSLEPVYIRRSEAEVLFEKRHPELRAKAGERHEEKETIIFDAADPSH